MWDPRPKAPSAGEFGLSMAAAGAALDDLLIGLVRAGMPDDLAKAIKKAAQEYLVRVPGYAERARDILIGSGFTTGQVDELMKDFEQILIEEQAA